MAILTSPLVTVPSSTDYVQPQAPAYRMALRYPGARSYAPRQSAEAAASKSSAPRTAVNDSSDDEDLAPIKLSAEAQAILGEDNSKAYNDKETDAPPREDHHVARGSSGRSSRRAWMSNRYSPSAEDGSPAPRAVRDLGTRPSPPRMLARDGSFMYKIHERNTVRSDAIESKTPAPVLRQIRVSGSRSQTKSPPSSLKNGSVDRKQKTTVEADKLENHVNDGDMGEDQGIAHPSTILRPRRNDEAGIHSTMRVRRIGTGTLLNGPVRRGMIRRQSDDDDDQHEDEPAPRDTTPEVEQGRRAAEPDLRNVPDEPLISYGSPKNQYRANAQISDGILVPKQQSSASLMEVASANPQNDENMLSNSTNKARSTPALAGSHISSKSSSSSRQPIFKIPSLPPLESAHDQENEPPPTFKRKKSSAPLLDMHEDPKAASTDLKVRAPAEPAPGALQPSPSRQPLAARSHNTPHRPAPAPPPKMSLIEAATGAGGSSRAKKSVHYVLNNRTYRRLDCIGRGGSSRVFRIMAENYQIFALKRVNLDEADATAIAGYKGEIDLLKKLENVDRVIRLFDYEVNEEKGVLSVMMELGESDFSKMLNEQLKGENARLDITFTRHYWKEMLECVKAVHDHGIVHSDLKPANFLLVKGQLKLIDFGIAGAIQDNTVNVHRENQIGTPNYMSPESLVCHTPAIGQTAGTKLLKLGRPSDVWSLGCILYQMTYGQPPFAHIAKQFERIMSIPNPEVEIKFPGTGVGGAVVPFGLIKTLRRCLQRDQTRRPTIEELLDDSDPFLNPVAISPDMLGRVIGNVVGYCRKREEKLKQEGKLQLVDGISVLPKDEEMRGWPGAFYEKLREAGLEGTAW